MILGENVRLRAVEREDLPRFVAWLNDPEVRDGLMIYLPLSLQEEDRWYEGVLGSPPAERPLVIEVGFEGQWTPIGNCALMSIDWRIRSAEAGIFIGDKAYWNKGHGTEVMKLVVQHGFQTLNLNRIFLRVYGDNLRAIRAYEKAGFIHEGCFRQGHYKNGQYVDVLLMSVLRSEWNG